MSSWDTRQSSMNEGVMLLADEASQNLMGGEYFHFKRGLKLELPEGCMGKHQ